MASFDLTVEDNSPLVFYAPIGAWSDPTDDPSLPSYSGSSFHTTSSQGATATINFNGTSISIFGGRRSGYGSFSLTVDGQNVASGSASNSQAAFRQLLASATGLSNGPHTAIFTSTDSSPIDIDYIDIQTQVGSPGSQLNAVTVDDSDPQLSYQPPDAWLTNNGDQFLNGTLHFTNTTGATVSLSFLGDAVAIFGTVSADHANIRVTLDGQTSIFNGGSGGAVSTLHTKTLLYFANNLGSQEHTLVVSPDQEQNTGSFVDIDAIQVFSPTAVSATVEATSSTTPDSSPSLPASAPDTVTSRKTMNSSAIAGVAIGVAVGIAIILALIFLWLRQRRKYASFTSEIKEKEIRRLSPELPMQGGFNPSPVRPSPEMTLPAPAQTSPGRPVYHAPIFPPSRPTTPSHSRVSSSTTSASTAPLAPTRTSPGRCLAPLRPTTSGYSHSRVSSVTSSSTAPMIQKDIPIIRPPRPPPRVNGLPARPSHRPPILDLPEDV